MNKHSRFPVSTVAAAVALTLAAGAAHAQVASTVRGTVAGTFFTPPAGSVASTTVAFTYQGVVVCFDANNNGVCDAGEPSTTTAADGSFTLATRALAPLVAQVSTASTNAGHAVTQRNVLRLAAEQISAATISPALPVTVAVTPLSTEIARTMDADGLTFAAARQKLATRLGVTTAQVTSDTTKLTGTARTAVLNESVILTNRFGFAAKMVDRGDTASIKDAQTAAMNVEGIPRYDHVFIVMLENKATLTIKGSPYAPKINAWLDANNQFTSYFATGNPSEPNYTALGGADDFGITDDSQWNCDATGANAVQDLPTPDKSQPGLASSPFTATCSQPTVGVNHNITNRPNLFNALTANGMNWRTYSESMNPGQDVRTDSVTDAAVLARDDVYPAGTLNGNVAQIGNPDLMLPMPAGAYKTKHHPGMAYQNVRSAPEFKTSNRTLGGGQWDAAMVNSSAYKVPAGYDVDQFGTDLQSGDIGNINFVVPDQCDDMHGISVTGKTSTGAAGTASDCSSVANNFNATTGGNIITRGDNYVDYLVKKIEASPIWKNDSKRVAIVLMFDEGNATSGFNSCCGWNPGNSAVAKPLTQNADGSFSVDTTVNNYTKGNRGHGQSIFGILTNQADAPKGVSDGDAYSHFSFVRTLQDMFQLADPAVDASYMNRSKYTEKFIAANILNLPEYAGSADTHFDSVRAINHAWKAPANYTQKQSADVNTAAQIGADAVQTNVWALKK